MIKQVNKDYECPQMAPYVEEVRKMERRFDGLSMEHIRRARNIAADALTQMATRRTPIPPGVFLERLTRPSIPIALPEPEEVLGIPRETLPGTHGLPTVPLPGETLAPSPGSMSWPWWKTASRSGEATSIGS